MNEPIYAKCGNLSSPGCGHVWAAIKPPMLLASAAKALRSTTCPKCGKGPKGIFLANGADVAKIRVEATP